MKFMMGIKWGPECGTANILYKGLLRSQLDYGLFIYFLWDSKTRIKLERIQYAGLRVAMGYRLSTPTNVMITESRDLTTEDRAGFLARRFTSIVNIYGQQELRESIRELTAIEDRYRYEIRTKFMVTEAWRMMEATKDNIRNGPKYEIFETDY